MDPREYYDKAAADYQQRFDTGVLGFIRRRERAAVLSLLEPKRGDDVLDAGCGTGFDAVPLLERGCEVHGVDLSPAMVAQAQQRGVDAEVADLHELDLGHRYGKILCAGPLEFCADPDRVLSRLSAHLAPGGRLVLLFPTRTAVGLAYQLYHRSHHVRVKLFTVRGMRAKLERVGLRPGRVLRPTPFTGVIEAHAP